MKISARTVLKIARLYNLADDNTPLKDLRNLTTFADEAFTRTEFTFNKQQYVLLFGSVVDDETIDDLWPNRPDSAEILPNPLDADEQTTPFQGKFVILFHLPATKQRLDVFLSSQFDPAISRSLWQKYIKDGHVSVNDQTVTQPKFEVAPTDDIAVDFPEKPADTHDVPIIYEDHDIIVVNKPSGLLTHAKGGIAHEQTLADSLRSKTSFNTDTNRPGIVHRLDRDTSGIIVIARTEDAAKDLQQQFADRTVQKTYLAVVEGRPTHDKAQIDLPIARHPSKPSTFRVDPNGKPAQTFYEVLATNGTHSLIKLQPKTGRTHQLRVHLSHLGTSIVGDAIYGKQSKSRLMLHAWQLDIRLLDGNRKTFTAPVPPEFTANFPEVKL